MRRFTRISLLVLSIILLLCGCTADLAGPAMWKVTSENGGVLYLFGSIHAADASLYPLPERVTKAYDASDALAVEFDVSTLTAENAEAATQLYSAMLIQDGRSFPEVCGPELYGKIQAILEDAGVYSPLYDAFGPVFWQLMLEAAAMDKADLNAETGVDSHFLELAHKEGKEVLEVESLEFQTGLLTSANAQEDAWAALPLIADNFDAYVKSYEFLFTAYSKGDIPALEFAVFGSSANQNGTGDEKLDELLKSLGAAEQEDNSEYMLSSRNVNMADAAASYLESGKKVFFVVGAGHMVGPDGIPALLEKMGYTVERA